MDDKTKQDDNTLSTLEDPGTTLEESPESSAPADASSPQKPTDSSVTPASSDHSNDSGKGPAGRVRKLITHLNIYILIFVLVVLVAIGITLVSLGYARKQDQTNKPIAQTLSQDALNQLKSTDTNIGDPKQILNIKSNTIFSGSVLVRSNLDVAGQLKISGALTLPGITVAGTSTLDQLQANSLAISGSATIQKGLNVNGNGTFGGTLSASTLSVNVLQLSGDLQLNRHIDAGGGIPSKSDGSGLGGGGTSSVSGSDTAGTITLNTGGSPPAGCFITVTFAQKFNAVPHVVITPVGSAAASLNYYVNRTTTNFSVCSANAAPASSSLSFDYIVVD